MKIPFFILSLFLFLNVTFSQTIGEISFRYDKTPEIEMEGLSDTLIWSGRITLTFSDLKSFVVEETELDSYMVRNKDKKEIICGTMLPERIEPCNEDFNLLFFEIDEKIRQFDFYLTGDENSLCSKRFSTLFHFLILPKEHD
jgi:hypothetical protein